MTQRQPASLTRRGFLQTFIALPISYLLTACGLRATTPAPTALVTVPVVTDTLASPTPSGRLPSGGPEPTAAPPTQPAPTSGVQALAPTPACGDDDDVTPPQTEGPFYTPDTPERTSFLESGLAGTRTVVSGQVLTTGCQPVAGALIDFWHADDSGAYDNTGYKLRGHQFADDQGRYSLETIVPGLYPGRTRHFHVKVQAPHQPVLTTQLYFPDEPANANDTIFSPDLMMRVQETSDGKAATFNFVLSLG